MFLELLLTTLNKKKDTAMIGTVKDTVITDAENVIIVDVDTVDHTVKDAIKEGELMKKLQKTPSREV